MSEVPQVLVDFRGLRKEFDGGFTAVKGLNFQIFKGDICGFIGPNGAGKTTTMRMLTTLEEPSSGDAFIHGLSLVHAAEEVRKKIGFMPDYYDPYEGLDVTEYLDFFAGAFKIPRSLRRKVIDNACDITGLGPLRHKFVETLSKGLKQRLMLAKTLLHDPDLLILDEPAAGLDPRARIEFRELLLDLRELGKTIFISSHILTELSDLVTRVAIIERGVLVVSGTLEEVLSRGSEPRAVLLVEVMEPRDKLEAALRDHPGIESLTWVGERTLGLKILNDDRTVAALATHLVASGLSITKLIRERRDLETLFMDVTKGELQ